MTSSALCAVWASLLLSLAHAVTLPAATRNVTSFGATPDDVTDDAAAIRKIVQWGAQLQGDRTGARMLYYHKNKFLEMQRGHPVAIYPGADGRGFRFNGNCQQVTLDSNEIRDNPAEGIELGGRGRETDQLARAITSNPLDIAEGDGKFIESDSGLPPFTKTALNSDYE